MHALLFDYLLRGRVLAASPHQAPDLLAYGFVRVQAASRTSLHARPTSVRGYFSTGRPPPALGSQGAAPTALPDLLHAVGSRGVNGRAWRVVEASANSLTRCRISRPVDPPRPLSGCLHPPPHATTFSIAGPSIGTTRVLPHLSCLHRGVQIPIVMTADEKLDFLMAAVSQVIGQLSTINSHLDDHDRRLARLEKIRVGDDFLPQGDATIENVDGEVLPRSKSPDDEGNHSGNSGCGSNDGCGAVDALYGRK
ncbi:hypothetical protein GUJ93_ZPchr0003g18517 [Zizania palustris]|uniref:Uncharacterized protein n=1 Tax=Zizania palustris TaxID=103762 RepID=A0A8J5VII2_ZIZPA|nr:hypothetical protein GUJ93_ZPchr0003g18517 [Zizania palustris]